MASTTASSNLRSSDNDSDSDDDGDEFLTLGSSTRGGVDREALVRKKLLESFYGKSAVAAIDPWQGTKNPSDDDDDEDDSDDGNDLSPHRRRSRKRGDDGEADNLDSPAFDVEAHTKRHVWTSSVHTLLETEEQLALQVRTLDSTMQTMVYENYSKFIDATDAIRSIGVNVTANQDGLDRLVRDMEGVTHKARTIEDNLGSLRDQVAEKIRIKRLLTRLDSLLNLPATLRRHIADGKYRTATESYLSAVSILSKHSEGFESLRTIEGECVAIMDQLKVDLRGKLLHWSGRNLHVMSYESEGLGDDGTRPLSPTSESVPPPQGLSSIFECAGALLMLLGGETRRDPDEFASEEGGESSLTVDDLQSMALAASMRWLDRLLDAHLIHVQERRFAPLGDAHTAVGAMDGMLGGSTTSFGSFSNASTMMIPGMQPKEGAGSALIPTNFLQGILESVQLFRSTCTGPGGALADSTGSLVEFVSEAFATFLAHVRAVLLEEASASGLEEEEESPSLVRDDDATQQDVSLALSDLVSSVKDMARRLTEINGSGWTSEKAQQFVDSVFALTESMVRRRVDQTFSKLRVTVVQTCILPLVERAVEGRAETTDVTSKSESVQTVVQLGGTALSDCLQLVDDTIRTIFSTSGSTTTGVDSGAIANLQILKQAVEMSATRFAAWLASTFEILAGGESNDPHVLMEAPIEAVHSGDNLRAAPDRVPRTGDAFPRGDLGDWVADDPSVSDLIDQAQKVLLRAATTGGSDALDESESVDAELVLGFAEVCRLAQGSVAESVEQSIRTHSGFGMQKKKGRGMFPAATPSIAESVDENAMRRSSQSISADSNGAMKLNDVSSFFQMACSRLVVLYAVRRGTDMARMLSQNLAQTLVQTELGFPPGPSDDAYSALQVVKDLCVECAALYGGPARAGPVPAAEDDRAASISSVLSTPAGLRKTSLLLDVERIFKERVPIYPHPQELFDASRNSIVVLACKVAFRSLVETVRLADSVSPAGFRQLQMDVELIKHMIPHYVNKEYSVHGSPAISSLSSLLADVMSGAGSLCVDPSVVDDDDVLVDSRRAVRIALDGIEEPELAEKFVIKAD